MIKDSFLNAKGFMALFLLAWSLYLFYPFDLSEQLISADGVTYAHIAKNIILDGSPGWQATWAAPFFSLLIAAAYPLFGNFAVAGMVISKLMTVLLPLAVYLLANDLFGSKVGVTAAVLAAFHPHFTFISGSLEPEAAYATMLVLSLWAIWRAFNPSLSSLRLGGEARSGYLWAVLGGILFSLTYQTRSEGLLVFLFVVAALGVMTFISIKNESGGGAAYIPKSLIIAIAVASFILASLPYLFFLKQTYGKWVISPKSTYVQIWMKTQIYKDAADLSNSPPLLSSLSMVSSSEGGYIALWGLTKEGKLKWQEPKGFGDLIGYLISDPVKSLKVYLYNLSYEIPGRIPYNSGQWLYPQVYPFYFVIPALFWLFVSIKRKEELQKTIFLLSPLLILLLLPIFTTGWWKYLLPYAPFLIIFAAVGMHDICDRLKVRYLMQAFTLVIVVYSIWTVKASPHVKHGNTDVASRAIIGQEQMKAGEWAQRRFQGTPNYMIIWSKLAYYLNGRWTAMPVADYGRMIWYAKKNMVDYIVFETTTQSEMEEIVRAMGNTPETKLIDIYKSPTTSYGVVFLGLTR